MRLGWHRNLFLRSALTSCGINSDGLSNRDLSYKSSILDDVWAVNVIRQYRNGKILMWSWLTRGLVSPELLAEWKYDGDVQGLLATE